MMEVKRAIRLDRGKSSGQFPFWNGSTWTYLETSEMFWDDTNKRLGIGTATPNQQLELTKSLRFPTTTASDIGVIYKDTTPFIHDFALAGTTGKNFFAGINAGNFTMTGATGEQASNLIGIGRSVLNSNTTGYFNIAIGLSALKLNTTGFENIAVGGFALSAVTTGQKNLGLGYRAGDAITTGSYNTAIGNWALSAGANIRTIGIGQASARYLSDGTTKVTGLSDGVYIGSTVRAGAVNASNEIVIGKRAVGKGTNTVKIGNTDTTAFYLNNDNYKLIFGAGDDASIYYDGTNFKINPKVVGSGILDILGTLQTDGYNSADGSAGITQSVAILDGDGTTTHTLTFKNGLLTAYAIT